LAARKKQTAPIESFSVKRERRPQLHASSAKLTSVQATTALGFIRSPDSHGLVASNSQLTRVENKLWVRNRKKTAPHRAARNRHTSRSR
jgi:hypothetical protein